MINNKEPVSSTLPVPRWALSIKQNVRTHHFREIRLFVPVIIYYVHCMFTSSAGWSCGLLSSACPSSAFDSRSAGNRESNRGAKKERQKAKNKKKAQCMSKCHNKGSHLPSNRDPRIWNVSVCDMAYGNQCVLLCLMQKHFIFSKKKKGYKGVSGTWTTQPQLFEFEPEWLYLSKEA